MRREAGLLVLFATLSSLAVSMIRPYIPLFGKEIGMPIALVGYLIFAYYGIEVVIRIPIGFLSDFLGHPIVIFAGSLSILGAAVFYLFSSSLWYFLLIAQLLLGLGVSITWVVIPSFITKMKSSLSVYTFSVGLGWLAGPLTGGFIRDQWGMGPLFVAFLVVSVLIFVVTLAFHREEEGSFIPTSPDPDYSKIEEDGDASYPPISIPEVFMSSISSFSDGFRLLKENKRILLAALVSFIMFMNFAMSNSLLPLRFSEIGIGSFLIGLLLTVRTGTSTLIRLTTEKILKIGKKGFLLIGGTLLTGMIVFLFSQISSFYVLIILSICWGFGGGLYLPIVFSMIADATNEAERGIAMGIRGTMGTAGSALGVLIFMNIAEVFNVSFSLALFGSFVMVFTGALAVYWKVFISSKRPS